MSLQAEQPLNRYDYEEETVRATDVEGRRAIAQDNDSGGQRLSDKCTWTWTTQGGVNGMRVTSKLNGNQIFLPAAGFRRYAGLNDEGSYGHYWCSSLFASYSDRARRVLLDPGGFSRGANSRSFGHSVRPVME